MEVTYRTEYLPILSTDTSKRTRKLTIEAIGDYYEIEFYNKLIELALKDDKLVKLALNS